MKKRLFSTTTSATCLGPDNKCYDWGLICYVKVNDTCVILLFYMLKSLTQDGDYVSVRKGIINGLTLPPVLDKLGLF